MNLEEFKESGLLDLYALNACTPDEKLWVEEQLELYPELKEELNRINETLQNYTEIYAVSPPKGLDQKIKKQLFFNKEQGVSAKLDSSATNLNQLKFYKFSLAASILVVIGLSVLLLVTRARLTNSEKQLAILNQEKLLLSEKINHTSLELADINQHFKKISTDDFVQIKLLGTEKYPNAQMKVFWNKQSKETYISLIQTPSLPAGKQFQLWALVNGKPINAGVFDSLGGVLVLSPVSTFEADLFAVTIEAEGGNESPTLSEMVVAGKVVGS